VAGTAIGPEATLVGIIIAMTIDAPGRCIPKLRRLMAGIALRLLVTTYKGERRKVVIESNILSPVRFVVTITTAFTLLPCVRVIIDVAVIAISAGVRFMHRSGMTSLAFQCGVVTEKRELRERIMFKAIVCPANFAMTAATVLAQHALMLVILAMAANTGGFELNVDRAIAMAVLTGCLRMRTQQREVGFACMVKEQLIPAAHRMT